jgi:6-phosphogluconolactonase
MKSMNDGEKLFVFDKRDGMSEFMIKKWEEFSKEAIERREVFVVALSGGKTPIDFYRGLAKKKEILSWHKTHVFLVDERFLPFNEADSNYRMLRETLLSQVPIPQENMHPIPTDRPTPQISAEEYEEDLRRFFKLRTGQFPEFDLILLGIGEEGHTASLFPHSPVLKEQVRLAAAVMLDEARHHRVTLTLPVINHARNLVFFVSGKNKAAVLERILNQRNGSLPASMVKPKGGNLMFLIDREANSQLGSGKKGD